MDLFSAQETAVADAADAVEGALRAAGFETERRDQSAGLEDIFYGMGEGLAEWIITAPGGQQTMLQMAYFDRTRGPVTMDVGPVLDLEDLAGSKVCALASRVEPRDYVDTAAALQRYPYGGSARISWCSRSGCKGQLCSRTLARRGLDARRAVHPLRPQPGDVALRAQFSLAPELIGAPPHREGNHGDAARERSRYAARRRSETRSPTAR